MHVHRVGGHGLITSAIRGIHPVRSRMPQELPLLPPSHLIQSGTSVGALPHRPRPLHTRTHHRVPNIISRAGASVGSSSTTPRTQATFLSNACNKATCSMGSHGLHHFSHAELHLGMQRECCGDGGTTVE